MKALQCYRPTLWKLLRSIVLTGHGPETVLTQIRIPELPKVGSKWIVRSEMMQTVTDGSGKLVSITTRNTRFYKVRAIHFMVGSFSEDSWEIVPVVVCSGVFREFGEQKVKPVS
ncbi:MAG: hypothetical protein COV91_01100 [Candidatus Taylorbacteria bacterium CG11_big_fil_rev_8_21_14_0_20_46_11]|uniref:Uncharacterized protein n=1 Tax=Candidatus Taylorbacteria bacterium CG11_big_fil_rev_8_21_14_0_20_46_11 TaxID=1975025 RepID=A0A2H0KCM9_9BACT|nr:MAG: hypothetical protein COV91_01100 [Candidatus Taylorbacteria bacterium CG11_big_fil_rev_8_21_14_0_20_46_11]